MIINQVKKEIMLMENGLVIKKNGYAKRKIND